MYIVKNASGAVVLIATRKEDAEAIVKAGPLDQQTYVMEKV